MLKFSLMKSSIMFVIIAVMLSAATLTAYAATDDSDNSPKNSVEIITRAEMSGNPQHGSAFTVYRITDSQRVGEVTTDENGRGVISLNAGEYYLRNDAVQYGYLCENARVFFTVGASGDVTVEITIQRDADVPDADLENIDLPKTGELSPVLNYVLGTLFLMVAVGCFHELLPRRKPTHYPNPRKGALRYA